MTFEQRNDSGALFRNEKKRDGDNLPDYVGQAKVQDHEYDISAWIKTSSKGTKYMSIAFKPPWQASRGTAPPKAEPKTVADLDDDIPF